MKIINNIKLIFLITLILSIFTINTAFSKNLIIEIKPQTDKKQCKWCKNGTCTKHTRTHAVKPQADVYLDTWLDAINMNNIDCIKKKDYVQICNGEEKFWVKIVSIKKNAIVGLVNNYLELKRNYKFGDKVLFGKQHIYEVLAEQIY